MPARSVLILTFILVSAGVTAAQDPPAVADRKTYLADVVTLLDKPWPSNRTVTIVAHGHSVPAGYFKTPVVDTFNAYPHLLHRGLKARHPHAVVNVVVTAIGGEASEGGAARFERDVLALRPDAVLIDYALNDRGLGLERSRKAWSQMIEQAQAKGARVILLSPTGDTRAKMDDPQDPLCQQAAQVRELAAKYHVGLVDSLAMYHAHVRSGGRLEELMSQVNHPNRRGHELVTRELLGWFPTEAKPLAKSTHVYKTVGDVPISADVYRPEGSEPRPVLVWIHGGALIVGSRSQVPKYLLDLCAQERWIMVSLDYRLAPEVKLPEIAVDLRDAFQWLNAKGPELFQADVSRIAVSGGSAGGFLTELAGAMIQPRPRALLSYWGYPDIDAEWASKPSEHHKPDTGTREEAYAGVNRRVLTNTDDPAEGKARGNFYRYTRQTGSWAREVTGLDPVKDREKLRPFCPIHLIAKDYPPILMIHGTADTDVPFSCSADLARELTKHGVPNELISIPNAEHGLRDGDPQLIAEAHARALEFLRKHLAD